MGGTLPLPNRSTDAPGTETAIERSILHHCARPHRRAVLESLADHGQLGIEDLAAAVAEHPALAPSPDAQAPTREEVATSLHHVHLHPLAADDLVVRDGDSTLALSSAIEPGTVAKLARAGDGEWAALKTLLADVRRQRVVACLTAADGATSLEGLAETVAAVEGLSSEGPRSTVDSVRVSLHHVDLPALATADVVDYDAEDGRVALASVPNAYRTVLTRSGV